MKKDKKAFFTVFYVPMVPIILYIFYKKKIHWSIWPSAILCVGGVYLLSDFSNATVRFGDSLVILCAFFWALHIIFIGKFIKIFESRENGIKLSGIYLYFGKICIYKTDGRFLEGKSE